MLRAISSLALVSCVATAAFAQSTTPSRPTAPAAPKAPVAPTTTDTTRPAVKAEATMTIVETAVAAGNFKTLASLLTSAGLVETLNGKGPFTVFAPTDEAFAKLPKEVVAELTKPENKAMLANVLTYHVVAGKAMASDVTKMTFASTVQGQRVDLKVANGKVMVDGATVTTADIACRNGVIHVIDTVIMPVDMDITQVATKAGKFNTLLAAIGAAGMTESFKGKGPFTVLAPTDEAFAKLPAGTVENLLKPENKAQLVAILTAHVVPALAVYSDKVATMKEVQPMGGSPLKIEAKNGKVMIGGATVVMADVEASNGVIHAIDTVILPATPATKTAGANESK